MSRRAPRAARHKAQSSRGASSRAELAKIARPRLPPIYARPRLLALLDDATPRTPLVWIEGPPGAGKTTLAGSWLAERRLPALWYQIDAGDRDLASFFHYLGIAAAHAAPRYRTPLPKLTPEYLAGRSTFARNFFRELGRRLKPPFVLVLDNLQEAGPDAPLYEALREGLEELPSGACALLISRAHPPPAFARWQLEQRLHVLDWNVLRLHEKESAALVEFVRSRAPRSFSSDEARKLHQQCDGWLAGMLLLLHGASRTPVPDGSLDSATPEALFDYFAGEVFNRRHPAVKEFLMQTALLPVISPATAERLTGNPRARALLDELVRHHHFTERRAETPPLYQYHPLFRAFLAQQGRVAWSVGERARLQHKAAALMEQAGNGEEALHMYLHSQDWDAVVRLIRGLAPALAAAGRLGTIDDAIERLPRSLAQQEPWLVYWRGVCRMPTAPAQALESFETAYRLLGARGDASGVYLAWVGVIDTITNALSEMARLDAWFEQFDRVRRNHPVFPSPEVEQRVAALRFIALVLRAPQHPDLEHWHAKAVALTQHNETPAALRLQTAFYLLTFYLWRGNYQRAETICALLAPIGANEQTPPLARVLARMAESWFAWLTGENRRCIEAMNRGLALSKQSGVHLWDNLLRVQGVASALSTGNLAQAEKLLAALASALPRARGLDRFYYFHECGWLALLKRDLARARDCQEQALAAATRTAVVFGEAHAHYGMSQVLHECGDAAGAERHLAESRRRGQLLQSDIIDFMCRLAAAQYALDRHDPAAGVAKLREGLAIGRARNYMAFSWWRPDVMSRLCAIALEHDIEPDYVRALIAKRQLVPVREWAAADTWPFPIRIYTLGRFSVLLDGEPLQFRAKTQKKPLELLKALAALGGREVGEDNVAALLWPDTDGDRAHHALEMALSRLRKLLGNPQAVLAHGRSLSLNDSCIWVDVWSLVQVLERIDAGLRDTAGNDALLSRLAEQALALYRGPFLFEESDAPWALTMRERLRARVLRVLRAVGQRREQAGQWQQAAEGYQRALEIEPLAEEFYQRLMLCYRALGRPAEALSVYRRCREILHNVLGIAPVPETDAIARTLRQEN